MSSVVDDVTSRLVEILRDDVLGHPDRDIAVDEPLGEEGVGLDSLALVQFLTAVEQEFNVQVPVEVWSTADQLSLQECTAAINDARAEGGDVGVGDRASSPTEVTLTRIWQDVLQVEPISRDDSFVLLQGDRDRVQQMLARARVAFGVLAEGLPVAKFVERPTISALAEMIDSSDDLNSPSLVVPLQRGGAAAPLFLVHAGTGHGFFYRGLASNLPPDRPVYSIRAARVGESGGESFLEASSVEAVAARYIREIKKTQPEGPYALGGACVGGVFAFEMARQLQAAGDAVIEPIVLFDSFINNADAGFQGYAALRAHCDSMGTPGLMPATTWRRGRYKLWKFGRAGLAAGSLRLTGKIARRISAMTSRLLSRRSPNGLDAPERAPDRGVRDGTQALDRDRAALMEATMDVSLRLVMAYRPRPIDSRIAFFTADDTVDFDRCWRGLGTGGIDIVRCPGGHLDMLDNPAVAQTAIAVAAALR